MQWETGAAAFAAGAMLYGVKRLNAWLARHPDWRVTRFLLWKDPGIGRSGKHVARGDADPR